MGLKANPQGRQAEELEKHLREMLAGQLFAVLSTVGGEQPYANLVGFAASPDLSRIYFATSRSTRKFSNLERNPKASLLVDNRSNRAADLRRAAAATALGEVEELDPSQESEFKELYLAKQPHLEDFVFSPNTARLCLWVKVYYVVSRFQNVFEFKVSA